MLHALYSIHYYCHFEGRYGLQPIHELQPEYPISQSMPEKSPSVALAQPMQTKPKGISPAGFGVGHIVDVNVWFSDGACLRSK